MAVTTQTPASRSGLGVDLNVPGLLWFLLAVVAALPIFWAGLAGLAGAWATPEYSHGPIIPILSLLHVPARDEGRARRRRRRSPTAGRACSSSSSPSASPLLGNLVAIDDIVFYALIVWIAGLILTGFGLSRGFVFWVSVLHLVLMLPLPNFIEWKLTIQLQFISSEIGVWMVRAAGHPGLSRRQRHRPRQLQAAGGRGLFGPALPVPDHELLLRLRRALPRPDLAQGRAAARRGAARGADELGPHRHHRHPRRPLRHRPGRGLPALLRGLGDLPLLHRHPVPAGDRVAAADPASDSPSPRRSISTSPASAPSSAASSPSFPRGG